MRSFPDSLTGRLSAVHVAGLERLRQIVGDELVSVYAAEVTDHREARGDDAQLFGFKLWKHLWFRLGERFHDDPDVHVVKVDNSWHLVLGPLRIGVYKTGDLEGDDAQYRHPDSSPTKRSYGVRNRAQLTLFDASVLDAEPSLAAGALNDLLVTHYGNPRDGFSKWYFGAEIRESGRARWAWIYRQDRPSDALEDSSNVRPLRPTGGVPAFDQQPVEDVPFQLRPVPREAPSGPDAE